MELKDVLKTLSDSDSFKEWRKTHSNAFLAHAFVMLDEANKGAWQIGYFDEASNTMTTFVVQGEKIEVIPDQEVLKADQRIAELKPDDVKLPVAEALAEAQKVRMQNYPKEIPAKQFFIIQDLAEHGAVFNITFFTMGFKTINVKLAASDGKVLHHTMQELAAFG